MSITPTKLEIARDLLKKSIVEKDKKTQSLIDTYTMTYTYHTKKTTEHTMTKTHKHKNTNIKKRLIRFINIYLCISCF